jgi:hypothetical protein
MPRTPRSRRRNVIASPSNSTTSLTLAVVREHSSLGQFNATTKHSSDAIDVPTLKCRVDVAKARSFLSVCRMTPSRDLHGA